MTNTIWCASFDIGKVNFAFYIEEYDLEFLNSIQNISAHKRYNVDGTTTSNFGEVIKSVCLNGKTILFKNSNVTKNCDKSKYLDPETFHNLTDLLDEYKNYWDKCSIFIIEQQMSFGKKHNTMALKLGQHCYSYFAFNYGRFKTIFEFPSYFKTQVLGAPKIQNKTKKGKITYKAMDKPARKKWSVEKASDILAEREDFKTLSEITSMRKKDDICDCLLQSLSYVYLAFVDKSI